MSTNVMSTRYLGDGKLSIRASEVLRLREEFGRDLAESNFIEDLEVSVTRSDEVVTIDRPWWSGGRSAYGEDILIQEILPCTTGRAELLLTWEGDGDLTGLRVVDGVVTRMDVEVSLKERQPVSYGVPRPGA